MVESMGPDLSTCFSQTPQVHLAKYVPPSAERASRMLRRGEAPSSSGSGIRHALPRLATLQPRSPERAEFGVWRSLPELLCEDAFRSVLLEQKPDIVARASACEDQSGLISSPTAIARRRGHLGLFR